MTQETRPIERPLLTIAIPTYNRSRCLSESLEALAPQLTGESCVELIISDNASSDETPAVVREYEKRGLKLQYLRNQVNLGCDANFLQCFEQANGKYLWLVGDDDIVVPGGLGRILQMLAERDYALIYLCPYSFGGDYLAERTSDRFNRVAQTIPNGLPFIRKIGTMITFMSSMIVNRDKYSSVERPSLYSFVGSNLIHLGWLLPVLGSGGTNLIVWEKLLAGRHSYSGGWGICRTFSDNLIALLEITLPGRKDIAAAIINPSLQSWFPVMIMQTRWSVAGPLGQENFRKSLEPRHKSNWRYWVYVFPLAAFPYWAARAWYLVSQTLNRAGRFLGVVLTYPQWHKDLIRKS